jgi:protocatechuate 3,4-dioxygenase beta subunit
MDDCAPRIDRRRWLLAVAALPAAHLASCSVAPPRAPAEHAATPPQVEGPFFRLFSKQADDLREPGMGGTALALTGRVLDHRGRPLGGALLDFWQCDDAGVYDVRGQRLRGHQRADAEGRYRLQTIVPGLYGDRTRHLHVKVQPEGGDLPATPRRLHLTTQLYFPGERRNADDRHFDSSLLMAVERDGEGRAAQFDFTLDLA